MHSNKHKAEYVVYTTECSSGGQYQLQATGAQRGPQMQLKQMAHSSLEDPVPFSIVRHNPIYYKPIHGLIITTQHVSTLAGNGQHEGSSIKIISCWLIMRGEHLTRR
jgi:hypothetical protein